MKGLDVFDPWGDIEKLDTICNILINSITLFYMKIKRCNRMS